VDNRNKALKEKINSLPDACGVYLFKDASGKIIYVGKAKSLRKRVRSYFGRLLDAKTQLLVAKIEDLEYRLTSSESRAELLEASLIKEHLPHYNVSFKDDKSFPLIRISDEKFPLLSVVRNKNRPAHDRSVYFGPYTDPRLLRQAIKMIRKVFGFRSCKALPKQPCLYYRLKLCPAPCAGKISPGQYKSIIKQIRMFLESKYEELSDQLRRQMHSAAQEKRYEDAASLRDRIEALAMFRGEEAFDSREELNILKRALQLKKLPERIEAFDISNISGKEACGSMVAFYRGKPDKNNYRRFRIKGVEGIDDYAMLREVVRRRYRRVIEEGLPFPDLVLIDGGKAHLAAASGQISTLGIDLEIASIAKERENIYTTGRRAPLNLQKYPQALNLIRRVRDEAHRFAINYHHLLRKKAIFKNEGRNS